MILREPFPYSHLLSTFASIAGSARQALLAAQTRDEKDTCAHVALKKGHRECMRMLLDVSPLQDAISVALLRDKNGGR